MIEKFKAPRGTFDVLPEQQPVRRRIVEVARRRLEGAGYGRMDTPVFEETDLFRAESASRRTSSRSRCSPSRTRAGARSPCARKATASVCRPTSSTCRRGRGGEALDPGALLPARAPTGRPLPAVRPGERRGDQLRTPARRRRADPARRRRIASSESRASGCGWRALARPRLAPPTSTSCAVPALVRASSPR